MIINFHTHIFPDKIAVKTIQHLASEANIPYYSDGTKSGLINEMKKSGIDMSVTLPIATKQTQTDSINTFAASTNGKDGIIAFGSVHPESDLWETELENVVKLGLKGIKLHPEYQDFFVDDEKSVRVIKKARELGLVVVLHSGADLAFDRELRCSPKRAARLIADIGDLSDKLVFAHMGACMCWDEVEEHLVGKNVYFDTSFAYGKMPDEQFVRIIKTHGADKILFGTDSPWDDAAEDIRAVKTLGFTEKEQAKIFSENACALLGGIE